jgi:putative oxidoreductase
MKKQQRKFKVMQLTGAALLIIGIRVPLSALAGSLLLGVTGIGGILTHIRAKDSVKDTAMILVLEILAFVVFSLYL